MSINEEWYKSFTNIEVNIHDQLGDMAAKVAVQNFDYRYATLLLFNASLYCCIEAFLHIYNNNVFVYNGIINPKLVKVARQYVIFGSDVDEFELLLGNLKEFKMINTGKFIAVCQSQGRSECDEQEMTKLFWKYKIVDAVVIKYEKDQALGYTYYPVLEDKCYNVNPVKLTSYTLTSHGNIFDKKIKKLNLCPLFVSTFIQVPYMNIVNGTPIGADGDLLRIIAYGLNTSVVMMTPQHGSGWGYIQKNGTWAGSLADVYEDLANISMTSGALTLSRFSDFQFSRSYYTIEVVWIIHSPKLQNEALKLLHPFGPTTRIALIVSYVLVILYAFVVKTNKWLSICRMNQDKKPSKSIVFYSWMICMGQAVIKLPTKSAFLQITILWVYYCFLIRTAYQVYLISSLKGKYFEDQIETIEDAMKAKYPFGGGAALKDYCIDYPAIYDNWINVDTPDIIPTALNIAKGEKFVLAMNFNTAKVIIKKHKIRVDVLPHIIVSTPTTIYLKKYSPLLEEIDLILSRLAASGLPEKIIKGYTDVEAVEKVQHREQDTLKLIHLTACYIILATGWILSLLFFY